MVFLFPKGSFSFLQSASRLVPLSLSFSLFCSAADRRRVADKLYVILLKFLRSVMQRAPDSNGLACALPFLCKVKKQKTALIGLAQIFHGVMVLGATRDVGA